MYIQRVGGLIIGNKVAFFKKIVSSHDYIRITFFDPKSPQPLEESVLWRQEQTDGHRNSMAELAQSANSVKTQFKQKTLWVESLMVSASTQLSLLRRHESHSPGQLFSLSLVEAEDGLSRFPLSKAGQVIQLWWLPCNFWMAQYQ